MSFFVSDSLKGIITEDDLAGDSPIKIVAEQQKVCVRFKCENIDTFEVELLAFEFEKVDAITIQVDLNDLKNILIYEDEFVDYCIVIDGEEFINKQRIFSLNKLEVNKDNYVTCKIHMYNTGDLLNV